LFVVGVCVHGDGVKRPSGGSVGKAEEFAVVISVGDKAVDDGVGEVGVADDDGLELVAEEGFDGGGVLISNAEAGAENTEDASFEELGVVESFEDGFGALLKTFTFFENVAEGREAGGLLGEASVGLVEIFTSGFVLTFGLLVGVVGAGLEFAHFVHFSEKRLYGFVGGGLLLLGFFELFGGGLFVFGEFLGALLGDG